MSLTIAESSAPRAHELSSLARARQIASVLAKHHLWHLIELMALEHLVPFARERSALDRKAATLDPAELRLALEQLGPTFMKLGQVLSTRADLLPPSFQAELARLQDRAPIVPTETILATIEAELGRPFDKCFATFDHNALATGSIGQAHLATLEDGTEVVVKVRRPGAVEQIDEDLKLLHRLAAIASSRLGSADGWDLVGVVREFDASLRAEVDYLHEGHNAERFERNFKQSTHVHIPRVYWDSTTTRVLTMERVVGKRITDATGLQAAGIDCDEVADNATRIVLKMLLEDGFFHADLHPGNLFIETSARIGLIDFGMVGVIDEQAKAGLSQLVMALVQRDSDGMVDALAALGMADPKVDRASLRKDLDSLVAEYYSQALGDTKLGAFLDDVFGVVRSHRLVMPSALSMLAKTMITAEGMVAQLDPSFQMMQATEPYVKRLVIEQNSPEVWATRFGRSAPDVAWLATESPRILRRAVTSLQKGELALAVEPKGLEPYVHRIERSANRIVLGMILSALVIAVGFVVSVYRPGVSELLDTFLAAAAAVGAVVLLRLVWLSRRKRPK
ncbi:MAG TPA: AarF/ABC1/UbiB kinase family protein [Candidatus Nitrosopolaris sp.]|nr:AarF/ABC1/UbiB kinase family protein [Candidatus Nitrosopolaris sp.]